MKILIAEDDKRLTTLLKMLLVNEGYETVVFHNGLEAYEYFKEGNAFDMALLDVMMPGMDGFTLCERLKEESNIPVVMLTAKATTQDQIDSFNLGADEYISKPFDNNILLLRIKNMLKYVDEHKAYHMSNLTIIPDKMIALIDKEDIQLSRKEYEILEKLILSKNKIVKKEDLIKDIWGDEGSNSRSIDTHIKTLRQKISKGKPEIKTVYGVGYEIKI